MVDDDGLTEEERRRTYYRQYRHDNRERVRAKKREEYIRYRDKVLERKRQWAAENPEAIRAHRAVREAVLSGKLDPPEKMLCMWCGSQPACHYHHYVGYEPENWLKVIPLCGPCHAIGHFEELSGEELLAKIRHRMAAREEARRQVRTDKPAAPRWNCWKKVLTNY